MSVFKPVTECDHSSWKFFSKKRKIPSVIEIKRPSPSFCVICLTIQQKALLFVHLYLPTTLLL